MLWVVVFLYCVSVVSKASKINCGNPLFKSLASNPALDGVISDVFFRDRISYTGKAQQMCNRYTFQACNGILTLSKPTTTTTTTTTTPKDGEEEFHIFVVGGRNSAPREYPHMALIGYGEYADVRWSCGGSLISEQYVLSAAHCSSSNAVVAAWIRLGELDLETKTDDATTMDFAIISRIVHPQYNPPSLYNDIALFKFKGISSFSAYIRPICLNVFDSFDTMKVTAIGFGTTGYGEQESPRLLSVELDVQDSSNCDRIYRGERLPNGFNANSMICAGYSPGGKDTCQGDSGGPLQFLNKNAGCNQTYTQIGIVSFGEGCALPNTPAIYTRISYFIPWIENIVWK